MEASVQEWMYYGKMEDFMFELLHLQISLFTLRPHLARVVSSQ